MYKSKFLTDDINLLYEAILKLESIEECNMFFEDLCTIKEIQDMAQRLSVAFMLTEKKPYQEIVNITRASTATIARVNKSLLHGADGYKLYFEKLKK